MAYQSIKNKGDYKKVAHRIEEIKDAEPNTNEAKELKQLVQEIIHFERRSQPVNR
jgi:hypothetical protein